MLKEYPAPGYRIDETIGRQMLKWKANDSLACIFNRPALIQGRVSIFEFSLAEWEKLLFCEICTAFWRQTLKKNV